MAAESEPFISAHLFFRSSYFTSRPHQVALQTCTYSSKRCIFHFGLWNIEKLTQCVLSHANITSMSGQSGAGQRGLSPIFGISLPISNNITTFIQIQLPLEDEDCSRCFSTNTIMETVQMTYGRYCSETIWISKLQRWSNIFTTCITLELSPN